MENRLAKCMGINMENILILANSSGGLYDFRRELLEQLVQKYNITVGLPDKVKTSDLEELGCQVVYTPMNRRGINPKEDFKLIRAYRSLIKKTDPALVLTYTIKPNIYGGLICRLRHIPYLATITGLGSVFQQKGLLLKIVILLYRIGISKAACIFFQNKENQDIFHQYRISAQNIRLVSGSGVNIREHRMEPYPMREGFCFLYVGRVMREKGIEEFLEAAEALHNEKTRFQIAGYCDEDYQETLDRLERRGVIEQLGFQPQVHELLAQASAVILPSYHEGMSNVLQEASSTGRPVLASDISGCREIFTEGETGLGFRPRDSADLIRAIRQFMAIPLGERALMGRKAREKMGREFDRERVVRAYLEEISKRAERSNDEFIR